MRRIITGAVAVMMLSGSLCAAGEVGFPEDFALAKDREQALKQLIPGTKDYYYYHCLHYQNEGRLDEVDEMLKLWIKRYNRTGRVIEIENRQALLRYEDQPGKSLEFIRRRLGLHFNHQREVMGEKPTLPTRFDQETISRRKMIERAMRLHSGSLQGFEDRGLDIAIRLDLSPDRRRHLLRRLKRPDYRNLPKLVVDDLNYRHSRGFGSLGIHKLMLLEQLDECLKLKPDLLNKTHFVNVYLTKLWPSADVDWRHDTAAREAYLDRLWAFVSRLNPSHNSLKAHVLYHRLVHDIARGVYDKPRFMAYIKLPRNARYVNSDYVNKPEMRRHRVNLRANYQNVTQLERIGNDEPLVRDYLQHFFVEENSTKPYEVYLNDIYLKHCFAETKIVNGIGDMEQWYSMLPPQKYKDLKERVDIDFAPTNKTLFDVDDKVALDIYVKNVKKLIVKVFEINTLNYYRTNKREVDTDIDLDGLVANEEKTYTYPEPPLRRVKRRFNFDSMDDRGVYVIEFIGNGKSSRALVRKGKLRFLERVSTAGHVFTILDEDNNKLPDAALWLEGHQYLPGDDGTITVPFSTKPGRQTVVLSHGDFASIDKFDHQAERYSFSAGIYVDREALLKREKAQVIVRPSLSLNGRSVTLSVLEEPTLIIRSVDSEGVSTTKEVKSFELFEDRESVYDFKVPAKLKTISFALKARVKSITRNKKIDLADGENFSLNGIDATEKLEDLHLAHINGEYVLDVLGKTGESKPDRPVNITVKHRDFKDNVNVSLQTSAEGRIRLGKLEDIVWLRVQGPEGTQHRWFLEQDRRSLPSVIHGRAGETLLVPVMTDSDSPLRSEFSFIERRGNTFMKDRFDALTIEDGFLKIDDIPAGDYDLFLKNARRNIAVKLTGGKRDQGYVLSDTRHLETRNEKPLQIASVQAGEEELTIKLENATKFARVHVAATRFMPEYPLYGNLSVVPSPSPYMITLPVAETQYVVGRDIGDEYRYILERKYARKFPGNMLKRPSLLLNPWAIRKTKTTTHEAKRGGKYAGTANDRGAARRKALKGGGGGRQAAGAAFANLDFLGSTATVIANLEPDDDGTISIPLAELGPHHQVRIVATDPESTVYREVSLPEADMPFNDLRLANALNPDKHYTEQKQVSVVAKDEQFVLDDIATSKFEVYDSLAKAYSLFATLSNDSTLVEFGFILDWPQLSDEEKREKYSKYACHELNYFLFEKDPDFFNEVVKPYIANKKDKTFMDRWLIGDELDEYLEPWAYQQLNIVERILLARHIEGEAQHTRRHVNDLFDLIPPNIEHLNHLFKTALKGSSLEATDRFGADEGRRKLEEAERLAEKLPAAAFARDRSNAPGRRSAAADAPTAPPKPGEPQAEAMDKLAANVEAPDESAKLMTKAKKDATAGYFADDAKRRRQVRRLYRKLEKTQEYVENNYYHLPIEQQNADLVTVNAFWNDYAKYDGRGDFFSTHLAEASRSFTEMMFALAVLDLPFKAEEHDSNIDGNKFTVAPGSPIIVYHKEIKSAQPAGEKTPILVSQNFYRHGERYRHVRNERVDNYITDEFIVHTAYGCHVVITNPTSSRQKLDVLLQIPRGAIPVLKGQYTRSLHVDLQPYRTWTADYFFYFPAAGSYTHYPVHVARNEELVAFAKPKTLNVVDKPTKIDRSSWDYISQHGSQEQVVSFLKEHNLGRVKLDRIAWRMKDAEFFNDAIALLQKRHSYNNTLWSYGIKHNVLPAAREYLEHANAFVNRCGAYIDTRLLTIDPVERKSYQHMEYWPLVNARAHQLGKKRRILNDRFYQQYMRLMRILSYRPDLDDDDLMSVTCYMLLQDRIQEAIDFFGRVQPAQLGTRLQYDYFDAYLCFYTENVRKASTIAGKYKDHPVERWRNYFGAVTAQVEQLEGEAPKVIDEEDRNQQQANLAATEPSFDFEVEARKVKITYRNLEECRVNYYLMDIELLFSRKPFVQQYSGQFAFISPNATDTVKLDADKTTDTFDLPERFSSSNVMIQILGGGMTKTETYFSNSMAVQVTENYGQVTVGREENGKPLAGVYVKVYARMRNGEVRFYKDGYTDLLGRFDYTSLSTNELDNVKRFSMLILSPEHGAVVREAAPPKQ